MRISTLHVTEAASAGTLSAVISLIQAQVSMDDGATLLYVRNEDTPSAAELQATLGETVRLVEIAGTGRGLRLLSEIRRTIRREAALYPYDVMHLHSTWAGVAGRIGQPRSLRGRTVYSPHGFSFLRRDLPRAI